MRTIQRQVEQLQARMKREPVSDGVRCMAAEVIDNQKHGDIWVKFQQMVKESQKILCAGLKAHQISPVPAEGVQRPKQSARDIVTGSRNTQLLASPLPHAAQQRQQLQT